MKHLFSSTAFKYWRVIFLAVVSSLLLACASHSQDPLHTFQFDALSESPEIEVLDYKYGSVKVGPSHAQREGVSRGQIPQRTGVTGYFPRGDTLYVKWRIRQTGQIFEDTVDLKSRLPRNIHQHSISFIIQEAVLIVYLVSPERRPPDMPPTGPSETDYRKTYVIYPDRLSTLKH
jgi:hypothetical protein